MRTTLFGCLVIGTLAWTHLGLTLDAQTTQEAANPPPIHLVPTPAEIGLQPTPVPLPHPPPQVIVRPPQVVPIPASPVPGLLPPTILAWDAELKENTVKAGEPNVQYVFNFTNVSSGEVTINHVQTSCGCTVAQLPTIPWKLAPGTNGAIPVVMNLLGRSGMVFKTITVNTDKGYKMLTIKTTILPQPVTPMTADQRARNQELAKTDRQAVFKGDCARCHVQPAIGKFGKDLYDAACGICHDAEHRATIVPDLHAIKQETNAEFWRNWIVNGKEGSLMPAFAFQKGGPLSDPQIATLVDYLNKTIPSRPATAAANSTQVVPHKVSN